MAPLTAFALAAVASADPDQPHLAQAWQALSSGDGIPGEVGLESYLYLEQEEGDFQGHVWDYGESCKKFELNSHKSNKEHSDFQTGYWYYKCNTVDCCFRGHAGEYKPSTQYWPDVKQWDISTQGKLSKVKVSFDGFKDVEELYDNVYPGAEQWSEKHRLMNVNYTYHLHREDSGDVISHRIDYSAIGAPPGTIKYGNFTVQHDIEAFKQAYFTLPSACQSGYVRGCGDVEVDAIERKYFKHSSWLRDLKQQQVSV
jgi:hypothetical protein